MSALLGVLSLMGHLFGVLALIGAICAAGWWRQRRRTDDPMDRYRRSRGPAGIDGERYRRPRK